MFGVGRMNRYAYMDHYTRPTFIYADGFVNGAKVILRSELVRDDLGRYAGLTGTIVSTDSDAVRVQWNNPMFLIPETWMKKHLIVVALP